MDSSDNEIEVSAKKLNEAKYSKILPDGTVDPNRLQDDDYGLVREFVKKAFPETSQVQKELEQTLKRTFILGRSGQKGEPRRKKKRVKSDTKCLQGRDKRKRNQLRADKIPWRQSLEDFLEIHSMWNAYVAELCKFDKDTTQIQEKLNRMDLHGAHITVVEHPCASVVNMEGIVMKETKETFVVCTPRSVSKTISKTNATFDVKLENPAGKLRIAGNSFLIRPAERVSKKMKSFVDFIGLEKYKSRLKYSQLIDED